MKFELRKASNYRFVESIVINTLEDLKGLEEEYKNELIVNFEDRRITIYDDYME